MRFDAPLPPTYSTTHITHSHPKLVFHILSTGCVMMAIIKVGNCLTVVPCYWICGQFCRHSRRQLDVKSLSGEIGSSAEHTHGWWYQDQREMHCAVWPPWMALSPPVTLSPTRLLLTQSLCLLEPDTWLRGKSDKDSARRDSAIKGFRQSGSKTVYLGTNWALWLQQKFGTDCIHKRTSED